MVEETRATPSYTMGYSEEFRQMLEQRSAETHAAYLLPRLKRGDRVLDFGCGPGTISVGLAGAVDPGELHGVDMEQSQVELARAAAAAGGHSHATFHVGDATKLPFEDGYFDVAHCHAVLMHVPDTAAVLAEVKRVLKPGGIIAAREAILRAAFLHPYEDTDAWSTFIRLLAANGGHPGMGMELKGRLLEAGFVDPCGQRLLRLLRHAQRGGLLLRRRGRLVLLAAGCGRCDRVRTGDPGAVRRVEGRPGRVEGQPRRGGGRGLRRVPGRQAVAAGACVRLIASDCIDCVDITAHRAGFPQAVRSSARLVPNTVF